MFNQRAKVNTHLFSLFACLHVLVCMYCGSQSPESELGDTAVESDSEYAEL